MVDGPERLAAANDPGRRRRLHVLLLTGLAAVALLLSFDPALLSFWSLRLYSILISLLPGVVLALACAGWGDILVRRAGPGLHPTERLLFAFSVGIGILSSAAGLLGFTISLNAVSAGILAIIGMLAGLPLWKDLLPKTAVRPSNGQSGIWQSMAAGAVFFAVALLLLIFSLTPPLLFDVTEYHLGAWSDYLRPNGTAQFIAMPHNFYARFPFPIESLYFVGLSLAPYIDTAPKVFNAVCVLACGYAAAVFVRRWGVNRTGQLLAALAAVTLPVMLDVSIDAMIDAPVALLIITAFLTALRAAGKFPAQTSGVPALFLPSLFLFSTALASKYTVAQLYLLPWLLICLSALLSRPARPPVRIIFLMLLAAAIPLIVWFGKNVIIYGNPLEPFFVSIFRPGDAAGIAREKFYIESHFPQSFLSVPYWTSLLPRLHEFVWLYLVACLSVLFTSHRTIAIRVAVFSAVAFLLWNLVRESQDRFLLPAMVLVSSTAIAGIMSLPSKISRRILAGLVMTYCTLQTATYALKLKESGAVDYVLDFYPTSAAHRPDDPATPREVFLEKNLGDLGKTLTDIRKQIAGGKLLLVYEARPYLFRRRAADLPVDYNVVWDDSVLLNTIRSATSADQAWQLLADAGYTHILINRQELLRYIQQYARKQQLLRLGVAPGEDPRVAYSATPHPEDLYPPFYRDRDWEKLRPIVHELLAKADAEAVIRHGLPSPRANVQPIDIIVAPLSAR